MSQSSQGIRAGIPPWSATGCQVQAFCKGDSGCFGCAHSSGFRDVCGPTLAQFGMWDLSLERRHCKELAVASLGSERLMGQLMGHVEPCRMKINLCQTHLSGDTCHLLSLLKEACSLLFLVQLYQGPFPWPVCSYSPSPLHFKSHRKRPTMAHQTVLHCMGRRGGHWSYSLAWLGSGTSQGQSEQGHRPSLQPQQQLTGVSGWAVVTELVLDASWRGVKKINVIAMASQACLGCGLNPAWGVESFPGTFVSA